MLVGKEGWRVAFGAARHKRTKNIEPGDLVLRERGMVTVGIKVITTIERNERALERSDGGVEMGQRDVGVAKGRGKKRP